MVSWMYRIIKIHQTVHCKYVQFIAHQVYLNKVEQISV